MARPAPPDPPELRNRQVAVARAYVEGLERDRKRLGETETKLVHATWEAAQLGAYNRALRLALTGILAGLESGSFSHDLLDAAENLVSGAEQVSKQIYECECGHAKYDHDENGCQFLQCKSICG